ncbi:uncharacterized protein RJT21DRAFT_24826 [Scheffersomyces amazonensis]|uniref:uncharacterized protein n=1 Tax=Scheffersomyces amazonensis TaxID=1078765 RepID=UPI00315D1824
MSSVSDNNVHDPSGDSTVTLNHHHKITHTLDEECAICLETINHHDRIGIIDSCDCKISNQNYHDKCILKWSSNSNSCPKCRKRFYKINIYNKIHTSLRLIQSFNVKDKLLINDAINNIPAEFIINSNNFPDSSISGITSVSSTMAPRIRSLTSSSTMRSTPEPIMNGVCIICSSSNYNFRSGLINCTSCNSNFHYSCLNQSRLNHSHSITGGGSSSSRSNGSNIDGTITQIGDILSRTNQVVETEDDYFQWCCPICDSDQESLVPYYRRTTRLLKRSGNKSVTTKRITRKPRRSNNNINSTSNNNCTIIDDIYDYNDSMSEIDDDFNDIIRDNDTNFEGVMFDDEYNNDINDNTNSSSNSQDNYYYNPPIINGGVLLRKELRAKQNLTKEEQQSWDLFEQVRNNDDDNGQEITPDKDDQSNDSTDKKRKRRKRKVEMDTTTTTTNNNELTNNSSIIHQPQHPSRISNLLSQLKTTSSTIKQASSSRFPKPAYVYSSPPPNNQLQNSPIIPISESPSSISPMSNSPMEINDSDTQYESDYKVLSRQPIISKPKFELTLDQKLVIQKYIRNNLRPLYNPLQENSKIKNENHYITINKTISRKIYSHIINESRRIIISDYGSDTELEEINSNIIESYFNSSDPNKLMSLIDKFVQHEISKL